VRIHGIDPLIQEFTLGFVLIRVLAFGFKHQILSRPEADDEVGPVLVHDTFVNVEHFKSQVIILNPCVNISVMI